MGNLAPLADYDPHSDRGKGKRDVLRNLKCPNCGYKELDSHPMKVGRLLCPKCESVFERTDPMQPVLPIRHPRKWFNPYIGPAWKYSPSEE